MKMIQLYWTMIANNCWPISQRNKIKQERRSRLTLTMPQKVLKVLKRLMVGPLNQFCSRLLTLIGSHSKHLKQTWTIPTRNLLMLVKTEDQCMILRLLMKKLTLILTMPKLKKKVLMSTVLRPKLRYKRRQLKWTVPIRQMQHLLELEQLIKQPRKSCKREISSQKLQRINLNLIYLRRKSS